MGSMSVWHWLVLIAVVALLFSGRGKVSDLMGDFAKGIKAFKSGLADDTPATPPAQPSPVAPLDPRVLEPQSAAAARREESKVL